LGGSERKRGRVEGESGVGEKYGRGKEERERKERREWRKKT
jgi:hypothetical protein